MSRVSIVEFLAEQDGYSCGYCGSKQTNFSHGMWAYQLTPLDYQNLIDRGWRRSGRYCYKPRMKETCCPLYTIRCDATNVKLSKSQKKTMKRMFNFLANDKGRSTPCAAIGDINDFSDCFPTPDKMPKICTNVDIENDISVAEKGIPIADEDAEETHDVDENSAAKVLQNSEGNQIQDCTDKEFLDLSTSCSKTQNNYDPSKPPCRKAKEIRRERRLQKLLATGVAPEDMNVSKSSTGTEPKTIEDWLNKPLPDNPAHRLQSRLVPCFCESEMFSESFEESYSLYKKYQVAIHKDTPSECSEEQFKRFLVKNPFNYVANSSQSISGPFHYQYLLDGKIIAVGVLDILPHCVSSVYFYYDPDYSFLSLGRYSALAEIALTRELHRNFPLIKYYYLGFYIHSCPKMVYKGDYSPSYLLCPETYCFQPIEKCKPKLNVSKYQRLDEDPNKKDVDGMVCVDDVRLFHQSKAMTYAKYRRSSKKPCERDMLQLYGSLVGKKCYKSILVYMS